MEKYAWKAKIKPGKKEEYIYRHSNIWPELVEVLKEAGICNYSIWIEEIRSLATMNVKKEWNLQRKRKQNPQLSISGTNI